MMYCGKETYVKDIAKLAGVSNSTIKRRWNKGLRDKDLIKKQKVKVTKVRYQGKYVTLAQLSKLTGLSHSTIGNRYRSGLRGDRLVQLECVRIGLVHEGIKLTNKDVLDIYKLAWLSQDSQFSIADIYNIHQSTVSDIKLGRRWNNLTKHIKNTQP